MNKHPDALMMRQLHVIEQIIRDETWLEGERRGRLVTPYDPVVRENVCKVILRIGAELRARCSGHVAAVVGVAA